MTPGAPFTPQTPGMAMDHISADWHTTDIEVRIKETHDDADLIHQTGVIRSVTVCTGFGHIFILLRNDILYTCRYLLLVNKVT